MTRGERIKLTRKSRGISQVQLAIELTATQKSVSDWECDKYSPSERHIEGLSNVLMVTTDFILKGSKDPWLTGEDGLLLPPKAARTRG